MPAQNAADGFDDRKRDVDLGGGQIDETNGGIAFADAQKKIARIRETVGAKVECAKCRHYGLSIVVDLLEKKRQRLGEVRRVGCYFLSFSFLAIRASMVEISSLMRLQ